MLEAIAGVLLVAAPAAYTNAMTVVAPQCPECRDVCAQPPQQKCKDLCAAGKVPACAAVAIATNDEKLLRQAATQHDKSAVAALAKIDKDKAPDLLAEACGLSYWPACVELGAMVEKKDPKFALEVHTRACGGGFANECVAAAKLDKVHAKALSQKACDLGVSEACPKKPAEKSAPRSR